MLICRKSIRRKDGTIVTAAQLGLKAICFEVSEEQHQAYLEKRKRRRRVSRRTMRTTVS